MPRSPSLPRPLFDKVNWDLPDSEIAKLLRVSRARVTAERVKYRKKIGDYPTNVDWENAPFGRFSDGEISRSLGVSVTTVRRYRAKHEVKPVKSMTVNPKLFTRATDAEIAELTGYHPASVRKCRIRRGLPQVSQAKLEAYALFVECGYMLPISGLPLFVQTRKRGNRAK